MWYINKGINIKELGLYVVHIIDDNNHEFKAICKNDYLQRGYYNYNELNIIDKEKYDGNSFCELLYYNANHLTITHIGG